MNVGFSLGSGGRAVASIKAMRRSVLLVDDDPDFRGLAGRMLAGMGLAVVAEAETCAAAAVAAAELRPAAALVDVGLPDGDGLALAQQLAALPWRPRVVITSSDPDAAAGVVLRRIGATGFVAKEDLPNGLLRALLAGE
jgi:DNA-binding NarL/FixJ family response regulator